MCKLFAKLELNKARVPKLFLLRWIVMYAV